MLFQIVNQSRERLLTSFEVLILVEILDEVRIVLVNGVVGQVGEFVDVFEGELLSGESDKTFRISVYFKRVHP